MIIARKRKFGGALKGAAIISIGGLLAKILGALYRIPLTNILKPEGMGVYQTVFPVYTVLLTFSSTGIPSALSKIIASGENEKAVLKKALSLFLPLGLLGSLLMAALAYPLSLGQGNGDAFFSYLALAPSVALVSVISCYRGYFQGKKNMLPTALSQTVEQAVKLAVGLPLCYFFALSPRSGGALACLAVTASELSALIYLKTKSAKPLSETPASDAAFGFKRLIFTVVPVTLSSLVIPLARVFDSFAVINVLGSYSADATALYGIYTGSVESVVGVPVAVCYGLAVASIPHVASAVAEKNAARTRELIFRAVSLTLLFAALLGGALSLLAVPFTEITYRGLSAADRALTADLLSFSFPCVILLSLHQTSSAVLIAEGKPFAPCIFAAAGVLLKAAIEVLLLKIPEINIFAALISDFFCYLIAVFLDLVYIISINKIKRGKKIAYENYSGGRGN